MDGQRLRYAATLSAGTDASDLPDVTCVWLSDTELQLQLAAPAAAPAPFTAEGGQLGAARHRGHPGCADGTGRIRRRPSRC